MNDTEIRKWLARTLGMERLDDRLWRVLNSFHSQDVQTAQSGDESDLDFLRTLSEHYLGAIEIFGGALPASDLTKVRHTPKDVSVEEEMRADAIWAAQVEAAINDAGVISFRQRVLGGKFLSVDEAIEFLNSPALACFSAQTFADDGVATYSHQSCVVEGNVDGGPGTEIVVSVQPGDHVWRQRRLLKPTLIEVTALPRWVIAGYENTVVKEYLAENHPEDGPELGHRWAPDVWGPLDTGPSVYLVVWLGSVLEELVNLVIRISKEYALGEPADLLWFLLAGDVPYLPPDPLRVEKLPVRRASKARSIRMDIRPWVSADAVLHAYRKAQKDLVGPVNRPIGSRNLALFKFVVWRQPWGQSVTPPMWEQMRIEWNHSLARQADQNPEWHIDASWRWGNWRQMYKEYDRVRAKILDEF